MPINYAVWNELAKNTQDGLEVAKILQATKHLIHALRDVRESNKENKFEFPVEYIPQSLRESSETKWKPYWDVVKKVPYLLHELAESLPDSALKKALIKKLFDDDILTISKGKGAVKLTHVAS